MSIKEKLKSTRVAIHNIWFEHAFTFDPGKERHDR
jgi:hypothetical protein